MCRQRSSPGIPPQRTAQRETPARPWQGRARMCEQAARRELRVCSLGFVAGVAGERRNPAVSPTAALRKRRTHIASLVLLCSSRIMPVFGVVFLKKSQPLTSDNFTQVDATHWVLDLAQQGVADYTSIRDVSVFLTAGSVLRLAVQDILAFLTRSFFSWVARAAAARPHLTAPSRLASAVRSATSGRRPDGARTSRGVRVGV